MNSKDAQKEKILQTLLLQYHDIEINTDEFTWDISRKTRRIKSVYKNGVLLFSLRTSDGRLVPTMAGGQYLLDHNYQNNRVIIDKDAEPYVKNGKSVYCRYVVHADENIVPEIEVLILSEDRTLLAIGTSVQPAYAMLELNNGVAVKSKHHL